VGTNQNVIEINGKKYNAITGKLLSEQSKASKKSTDGLVNNANHKKTKARKKASHVKKKPNKSQTLMRSAVKKPVVKHKKKVKKVASVAGIRKPTLKTPKHRISKASAAKKSTMISHFGDMTSRSSVIKKVQHLPVKKQRMNPAVQTTHTAPAIKEEPINPGSVTAARLIEKALSNATSHEQPVHHRKKRKKITRKLGVSAKAITLSSTVLAGVLLGGFFAVQNVPNLSMRVASARAGFSATLPDYHPSGFSFAGPINHTPGQITVSYQSNTDDRSYQLTQRASNWNSDALLSNFVVASNQQYQTYLDRGRTLFIYDESNATWVDNGIWYQIEGKSQMTTDQLVRIAASM